MAFFKFLKMGKKEASENLDLPPAPPSLGGFDEKLAFDMPDFEKEVISGGEFKFPEEELPELDKMPEFPGSPELEEMPEELPFPPIPSIGAPQAMPELEQIQEGPKLDIPAKMEKELLKPEKKVLLGKRAIYIKVNQFRSMVSDINKIRRDLKESEDALTKLENIKNAKDKSFDKIKSSLDDLQKKLIFIDKTFEGE